MNKLQAGVPNICHRFNEFPLNKVCKSTENTVTKTESKINRPRSRQDVSGNFQPATCNLQRKRSDHKINSCQEKNLKVQGAN